MFNVQHFLHFQVWFPFFLNKILLFSCFDCGESEFKDGIKQDT